MKIYQPRRSTTAARKRAAKARNAVTFISEAVEPRMMLSSNITITTQPTNQSIQLGQAASFTAAATGAPAPTVQWEYSVNGGATFSADTADLGPTTDTLTVTGTANNNGYLYEALFSNSTGSLATNSASLTVDVPLTVTMEPTNQNTYQGGSATFTAAVEGTATPITVQWQESTDNGYNFNNVGSPSISNTTPFTSTYTVTNAPIDEYEDEYRALFTDSEGNAQTYPANLDVSAGVAITQQSYSQAVFPGGTATFTASAGGVVAPSVQWFVSTPMNGGSYSSYTPVNGAVSSSTTNTTSTSLAVPSTDAGNLYEAVFTNSSGSETSNPAILNVNLTKLTEGDLVVLRLGDAAYPDVPVDDGGDSSDQMPIYLDEFTPTGSYVGSVAIPSSGPDALTLPGAGDTQHEGVLTLSTNGAILTFGGYQVPEGSNDANLQGGDFQPVLGYIYNNTSSLNTTTIVDSYGPGSDNPFFRGGFTNYGDTFWTFGKYAAAPKQSQSVNGNGGLEYVTGTGPTAVTTDVETYADWRYVTVINGQLYGGVGSSSVGQHGPYIIANSAANVSAGTLTEPDTDQGQNVSVNTLLGTYPGNGESASSIAMVDVPGDSATQNGENVLYTVGDQNYPGITKYYWSDSSDSWVLSGYSVRFSTAVEGSFNPTGLIAVQDPTNPNWVDLTVSGEEGIFTYVDTGGATAALPADAFTQLASAPIDGEFRGISVAPLFWEAPDSVASWNAYTKTLTVTGAAGIIADPGSDEPIIVASGSAAVVTINPTSDLQIHLGGLSLTDGASAIVTSLGSTRSATNHRLLVIGVAGTTTPPLFNIDSSSNLNLTDNDLVIHDGNLASVTSFLKSGYNAQSGYWNGNGIQSSSAASQLLTALGVNQATIAGTFDGETVNTSDVEVRYTYYGDANLNGKVDGSDYSLIDNGYLRHLTGWSNGDFNYDGIINGSDYTLIDNAYNTQSAALDAQIATPDAAISTTAIQRPAVLASSPTPLVDSGFFNAIPLQRRHKRMVEQLEI